MSDGWGGNWVGVPVGGIGLSGLVLQKGVGVVERYGRQSNVETLFLREVWEPRWENFQGKKETNTIRSNISSEFWNG